MTQIPAYTTDNVESILAEAGNGALPHIPDDTYSAIIVNSEMKDTSKGGKYIALTVLVNKGEHKGTELVERLNIINDNTVAVKIAYETLARIAKAVGLSKVPSDTLQLHNKPLLIKTKTEAGGDWTDKEGNVRKGNPRSVIDSRGYAPAGSSDIPFDHNPAATAAGGDKMPWE